MSNYRERVVVTGLGAVTPVGGDVASSWAAVLAGKSGVHKLTESWAAELPVRIAAPAVVDPAAMVPSLQFRRMDRCQQLALLAARQAWQDAGPPRVEAGRLGVSMGTGVGGVGTIVNAHDAFREKGWQAMSPFSVPMLMANGLGAWIGIELGAHAGVHTAISACASSAEAIGYGIDMIRSGRADVVVAGGAEAAITPTSMGAFAVMRALSLRNDHPEQASRPFDKGRDGFVMGEGAGAIVLESAEHAARRGADVLAIAAGAGYSTDSHHIVRTAPDGAWAAVAMQQALTDAGASPEQVVHINAHATSTPVGDAAEEMAIRQAIGDTVKGVVVSATKSMTGHLLGGAGAVESVLAICALRHSVAPPTINLEEPDDEIVSTGIHIATEPQELHTGPWPAVALSNSFGFGGHNVTLAFMRA